MKSLAPGLAAACAGLLFAVPAGAGTGRTFVSGHGTDTGSCTPTAPCRSFAYAIGQTNAGGEITILDPAGYGPVAITKEISIVNDGVGEAGITVGTGGQNAISVNAGPSDQVNLRGLTLVGQGLGENGIDFLNAGVLNVQNCVIRGFTGSGVRVEPTDTTNIVNLSDTIASGNEVGFWVIPAGAAQVQVFFERTQALGNSAAGFKIDSGSLNSGTVVSAGAVDSAASGNGIGFVAGNAPGTASFMLSGTKAATNLTGLGSAANATVFLSAVTISGNRVAGFSISDNGVIASYGNNAIADGNNVGSLTPAAQQ